MVKIFKESQQHLPLWCSFCSRDIASQIFCHGEERTEEELDILVVGWFDHPLRMMTIKLITVAVQRGPVSMGSARNNLDFWPAPSMVFSQWTPSGAVQDWKPFQHFFVDSCFCSVGWWSILLCSDNRKYLITSWRPFGLVLGPLSLLDVVCGLRLCDPRKDAVIG